MNAFDTISIYGSHDASVTFIDKNGEVRIYEYERFVKKRYAMFSSEFDNRSGMGSNDVERKSFLELIKNNISNKNISTILYASLNDADKKLVLEYFPNVEFIHIGHHFSHAASGYYLSKFKNAIVFSVDGGGVDNDAVAMTKAYVVKDNLMQDIACKNVDFGNPYSAIGFLISEIRPGAEGDTVKNSLVYAGKIMGLCAYGKVRDEWKIAFAEYYDDNNLDKLCNAISIPSNFNSANGQVSYDLAATSQYTFEQKMNELIFPYIEKYNCDIVLVGGCALNVLYNQKLHEYLEKINLKLFVPPNPNDCGQSYGMFVSKFNEIGLKEIVYNGIELLDNDTFDFYLNNYDHEKFSYSKIVNYLKKGKILGVINGNSEVGPRALGNRSIICDPSFEKMKDILNAKVKFREWYRPFAPVCRLEDKDLYFENAIESLYMSYAPKVKLAFKSQLKSIVHEDDTTRLQTVTKKQHEFFYKIISELAKKKHIPVILNTSFNINGLPILTTLKDAFYVLDNTQLDYLVVNNKIFKKK